MKLNYYKFKGLDWQELAMIIMIFDMWLFKVAGGATPKKRKGSKIELPDSPEVLLGLVDLDLDDIECFLPPHVWESIKDSIVKIEGPGFSGSGGVR